MKKLIICITLLLSGCATMGQIAGIPVNVGHGYKIEQKYNEKCPFCKLVGIEYKDYQTVYNDRVTELDNRLADENTRRSEIDAISEGGMIIITIKRYTIEAANTSNFEYVIFENDIEIFRQNGEPSVPDYYIDSGGTTTWSNIEVISLPHAIKDSITLYVIDNLGGGRDEFKITSPTANIS